MAKKPYVRHIAVLVALCLSLALFIEVFAQDATFSDGTVYSKTAIKSIIPYVYKVEGGIEKSVPVQSREDTKNYPAGISLMIKMNISDEHATLYKDKKIHVFKLKSYQNPLEINSMESVKDFTVNETKGFEFSVSVPVNLTELSQGEIFCKYVLGVSTSAGYIPISDEHYIDDINSLSNITDIPAEGKTKKGLQVQMQGDATNLRISHTVINLCINDIFSLEKGVNTEIYHYAGQDFFFNTDKLAEYDKKIKFFTANNIIVTAVLVLKAPSESSNSSSGSENESPAKIEDILIHKNSVLNSGALYYGINTADAEGAKYFEALMSCIADRYVKEDIGYGKISNIILGDEIGRSSQFNNTGAMLPKDYVEDYMRTLRIVDSAIRSRFGGARVYIPFDKYFASKPIADKDYVNKELIDLICENSLAYGNFPWNIAFHAYNEDITKAAFWKEPSPLYDDYSTPLITMKNIETLCNYINIEKGAYLKDSKKRKVMLSDQGFSSSDNTSANQELQAAAFCYAYNKVRSLTDIEAFIWHRHVDANSLEGANLGLWKEKENSAGEPLVKKSIYNTFKFMDTDQEVIMTEFAKKVIGITDWSELIPYYSLPTFKTAVTESVHEKASSNVNLTKITKFTSADISGFMKTANVKSTVMQKYENSKSEFDGNMLLRAEIPNLSLGDYSGIYKIVDAQNPIDIKNSKYIKVNLRVDTKIENTEKIPVIFVLEAVESTPSKQESSNNTTTNLNMGVIRDNASSAEADTKNSVLYVFEGTATIDTNKDTELFFNIEKWAENKTLTGVRLLLNPTAEINPEEYETEENTESAFVFVVENIYSVKGSKSSPFKVILNIILIILGIAVAGYGILFIRAQYIRYKRRKQRALKKQAELERHRSMQNRELMNQRSNQQQRQNPNQQQRQQQQQQRRNNPNQRNQTNQNRINQQNQKNKNSRNNPNDRNR